MLTKKECCNKLSLTFLKSVKESFETRLKSMLVAKCKLFSQKHIKKKDIVKINYLVISLFFDLVLPYSYLYL